MKTKTKVIIGVSTVLVTIFLLIGIAVGGWYYIGYRQHEPELRAKLDKAWDEGKQFGLTTDQNGCVAKGLTFTDPPNVFDVSNDNFDTACLRVSRKSPGFCDGVALDFGDEWPERQCPDNKQNRKSCITAYDRKQFFCRMENGK